MEINSCNEYKIILLSKSSKKYILTHSKSNASNFQNPDTKNRLKIYIFVDRNEIIYVGATSQSMSTRLRIGLNAAGSGGYHGYKFKKKTNHPFKLFVFSFDRIIRKKVESIEAELVYSFRRKKGKWPEFQTEIHFNNTMCNHKIIDEIIKKVENS